MTAQFNSVPRSAYTINETASLLGISRRSVYDLLSKGKLRAVRIGAHQRIPASELERLVNSQTRPTVADTRAPPPERRLRADDSPPQAAAPSEFANAEDFKSRGSLPVAPLEKPQAPAAQEARVKLSELLAQVREPSAGR